MVTTKSITFLLPKDQAHQGLSQLRTNKHRPPAAAKQARTDKHPKLIRYPFWCMHSERNQVFYHPHTHSTFAGLAGELLEEEANRQAAISHSTPKRLQPALPRLTPLIWEGAKNGQRNSQPLSLFKWLCILPVPNAFIRMAITQVLYTSLSAQTRAFTTHGRWIEPLQKKIPARLNIYHNNNNKISFQQARSACRY